MAANGEKQKTKNVFIITVLSYHNNLLPFDAEV